MAFFEQLGKKLSDAGQGVAQSSRNAMDIAKLNSAINDKKKQIAQGFSILGEHYYQLHREDAEEALAATVYNISALYKEIRDCEEQIKTIRGVVKCAKCGAELPPNTAFCTSCGAPVAAPAAAAPAGQVPEGMKECPNCHKLVPVENKFCTGCGSAFTDVQG